MNTFPVSNKTEWASALKQAHEGDLIEALEDFESEPGDGGFIKKGKYRRSPIFNGSLKELIEATNKGEWPPKPPVGDAELTK